MAVLTRPKPSSGGKNAEAQRGFTMPDLLVVLTTAGVLFGSVLTVFNESMESSRDQFTQTALETARTALVAFAAQNNGCLPFAADYEGGLPDTNDDGIVAPSAAEPTWLSDTGEGERDGSTVKKRHGGDVPWAELGLAKGFLDGDGLRVQYYVAEAYSCKIDPGTGLCEKIIGGITGCKAGFLGFEWDPSVTYTGSTDNKLYVYFTPAGQGRQLYEITGTLPAGNAPNVPPPETTLSAGAGVGDTSVTVVDSAAFFADDQILIELDDGTYHTAKVVGTPSGSTMNIDTALPSAAASGNPVGFDNIVKVINNPLASPLLEVRRGPDVTAVGSQSDVLSSQNVFVLIAPGKNRNANATIIQDGVFVPVERTHIRDSNHVRAGGNWELYQLMSDGSLDIFEKVEDVIFSATPNVDPADHGNDGDDTLLVMSFTNYKAALSKFGLNMEPLEN